MEVFEFELEPNDTCFPGWLNSQIAISVLWCVCVCVSVYMHTCMHTHVLEREGVGVKKESLGQWKQTQEVKDGDMAMSFASDPLASTELWVAQLSI